MNIELATTKSPPDFELILDATYVTPLMDAIRTSSRLMGLTDAVRSKFGVMVNSNLQRFGPIDVAKAIIDNPVALKEYGSGLTLREHKKLVARFRKVFGGPLRQCLTKASETLNDATLYFVFFQHGMVVLIPSLMNKGFWRMGTIRVDGARTMDDERACVEINIASLEIYRDFWNQLNEIKIKATPEVPSELFDALEAKRQSQDTGGAIRYAQGYGNLADDNLDTDEDEDEDGEEAQFMKTLTKPADDYEPSEF